jgi:hypothetical protein
MSVKDRDDADLKLERLVDRLLHDQPVRRAPLDLESRVFQELARRAALPWWRRSFVQWPRAVRAVFLGICVGLGALTILGGARIAVIGAPSHGLERALAVARAAADAVATIAHAVPLLWIYEALAVAAVLYAVMFALGAAAYRTLYLEA